ncbi:MAG: beta-galactosidase [Clostridiales bacterium]|nr:beta-galactosidase [Clostridiales bacterium]
MKIDLSGVWQAALDACKAETVPLAYADVIHLPGTTSAAGLGPVNRECPEGYLTDEHEFEGYAWFRRSFVVPEKQPHALLRLERTRMTTVWLDGVCLGSRDSLCSAHEYSFEGPEAGEHELVIRVSNVDYPTKGGHMTSKDTQTNWNGVTGEISLTLGETILRNVNITPRQDLRSARVTAEVIGGERSLALITVDGWGEMEVPVADGRVDVIFTFTEQPPLWDEFHPNLLTLRLRVNGAQETVSFGMRRFGAQGRKLLLNGREIFLRGKHDGMVFPLTGYAPTDVEGWLKVMGTAKEYGINHYRFHTCCPPEAAFVAADQLGIYMEPELPFWGTVAAPGEEGYNEAEQAYLIREGFGILRSFGHHPSFMMMSLGNELWGSPARLNEMLKGFRAFQEDKLYTSGSNNFQFVPQVLAEEDVFCGVRLDRERLFRGSYAMCDAPLGHVQTTEPESVRDYDEIIAPAQAVGKQQAAGKTLIQFGTGVKEVEARTADVLLPGVPVVSHEIGQYTFYPDFSEIDRYTGPVKARNFQAFARRLREKGLFDRHEAYFRAAGALAVECYRRELETALRSRELSGFQMLDLQDFPGQGTALVGVLNAFMESKGLVTPEKWRSFCAPCVVLGRMERFVLADGDEISLGVMVSETNNERNHSRVTCSLMEADRALRSVTVNVPAAQGRLTDCGRVSFGRVEAIAPRRLNIRLELEDGTWNEYPVWVFPKNMAKITREGIEANGRSIRFVSRLEDARPGDVVIPEAGGKRPAEYCTDFWCYPMFRSISESMGRPVPVGTMGLCIDPTHPALKGFPADEYTTPPWYRLLRHAHCEVLPEPADMAAEMIDNVERCERMGVIYRKNGVLHCTIRLWEIAHEPEAQCLAACLANMKE